MAHATTCLQPGSPKARECGTTFDYTRFYDRIAPFYAAGIRVTPRWWAYTRSALAPVAGAASVLEVGPGPGMLLDALVGRHPFVAAVDLSMGMLRQARGRAGAPVVRGDAASLPFADAAFEAVVTTFAFSAFPDGDAAMSELARVLAPGGQLALVDAGLPRDGNALGSGIAGLWERFGDFMRDDAALMTEAGLVVETYRELGAFGSVHLTVGRKRLATPG